MPKDIGPSSTFGTQSSTAKRGIRICRNPLLKNPFSWFLSCRRWRFFWHVLLSKVGTQGWACQKCSVRPRISKTWMLLVVVVLEGALGLGKPWRWSIGIECNSLASRAFEIPLRHYGVATFFTNYSLILVLSAKRMENYTKIQGLCFPPDHAKILRKEGENPKSEEFLATEREKRKEFPLRNKVSITARIVRPPPNLLDYPVFVTFSWKI